MPISIACPGCATRYRLGEQHEGKLVKCRKCGGAIEVRPQVEPMPEVEIQLKPEADPVVKVKPPPLHTIKIPDLPTPALSTDDLETAAPAAASPFPFAAAPPRRQPTIARTYTDSATPFKTIRPCTAAPDGFSPLLLLVYVVAQVGCAIYLSTRPNYNGSRVWAYTACQLISFFTVVAPMIWAGVSIAARAMRYELAQPAYIKGAAIAITPALVILLDVLLPFNLMLKGLIILLIIPFTYLLTSLLFSLNPLECLVTYVLGVIGAFVGWVLQLMLLSAVILNSLSGAEKDRFAASGNITAFLTTASDTAAPVETADNSTPQNQPQAPVYAPPQTSQFDPIVMQLTEIEQQVKAMTAGNWMNDQSREQMTKELASAQDRAESLRLQCTTVDRKNKFEELAAVMGEAAPKVAALPTELPDDLIYQPITESGGSWQPMGGDSTVPASFRRYRLSLPNNAKVDLRCTEDAPEGLSWDTPLRGRFTITTVPRVDPRQQRPWVITRSYMKPGANVFTVQAVNIPVDISYGQINGVPATRVASQPSDSTHFAQRWVKYVMADGKQWVVITCSAEQSDAQTLSTLEDSAWSVHQARSDEPRVDPFNVDSLVARITEERAAEAIRRMGSAAEPALLKHIDDSDGETRAKVIELLGDIGTSKSVPALLVIAKGNHYRFTDLARASLRKLAPDQMDDTTEALLDLNSNEFMRRGKAVTKLAGMQPKADDPHRSQVALALTALIRDRTATFGVQVDELADALAAWQTPASVPSLLPLLDHDSDSSQRQIAMTVLARTKDKRAVFPIVRWLIEDTEPATKALISMGPVAEDDVLKALSTKDEKARLAACAVLGEIGTKKSLKPLDNLVYYKDGPSDAAAGTAAIAQIKERMESTGQAAVPKSTAPTAQERQNNNTDSSGLFWTPPSR
jgi:HEAT repeat protein/predicted RNA-binding Zn ribbon-like protein